MVTAIMVFYQDALGFLSHIMYMNADKCRAMQML
jgi:hypothetical protein